SRARSPADASALAAADSNCGPSQTPPTLRGTPPTAHTLSLDRRLASLPPAPLRPSASARNTPARCVRPKSQSCRSLLPSAPENTAVAHRPPRRLSLRLRLSPLTKLQSVSSFLQGKPDGSLSACRSSF